MHPHTIRERNTLFSDQYAVHVRTLISLVDDGINMEGEVLQSGPTVPSFPANMRGFLAVKPTTKRILGYEPFLSATVSADLDDPVMSAEIRLDLGRGAGNLSPYMSGPAWDWSIWEGAGALRPMFDAGVYIQLEAKCVSSLPRIVVPPAPNFQASGPVATSASGGVDVAWPSHQRDDVGIIFAKMIDSESTSLTIPAGFVRLPNFPVSVAPASGGAAAAYDQSSEFVSTADPTTGSHTPIGTPRAVLVFISYEGTANDLVDGPVTYGGVTMTRFRRQWDGGADSGNMIGYFLGAGIPTGTRTVSVGRTESTTSMHVTVITFTAGGDCELVDHQGHDGSVNNIADPAVTLDFAGRTCVGVVAEWNGVGSPVNMVDFAGQTVVQDHDFGVSSTKISRRTTPGTTNPTMGYTVALNNYAIIGAAVAVIGGTGAPGVKLDAFWCRATSNAMTAPNLARPGPVGGGGGIIAQMLTWRGCITSGNPYDVNPTTSTIASAISIGIMPNITTLSTNTRLVHAIAAAIDSADPQLSGWSYIVNGGADIPTTEHTDVFRTLAAGGGFGVASIARSSAGAQLGGAVTLASPSVCVTATIALKPPPVTSVADDFDNTPWRPFFTGRIDRADPARGNGDVLVLKCRDMYSDALDTWLIPDPVEAPQEGSLIYDADEIEDLLTSMYLSRRRTSNGGLFAVIGQPNMAVTQQLVEPKSLLLAMRDYGLQNGWDLRGRWGTAPYSQDQFVLTYYQPDRTLSQGLTAIPPGMYFGLGGMGKGREDVRNHWRVTPSDPPRVPINVESAASQFKYGYLYAGINEDAASLIREPAQAQALANALLSDTEEPKVTAEVNMRFYPYFEINDVVMLTPNNVHHDAPLVLSISGFTHTLPQRGIETTVLRTRSRPAAANREWRQMARGKKLVYVSPEPPSGQAAQGARWLQRRGVFG